jgi:hypothetical protein
MIHLDNACLHNLKGSTAFMVRQVSMRLLNPPYSSDIALSNFYIFVNIKTRLRERYGIIFEELQSNVTEMLASISGQELF